MNLDREIAERVMGWREWTAPDKTKWWGSKEEDMVYPISHPTDGIYRDSFRPSTNIQHAMEVEAEMFRRGLTIVIVRQDNGSFDVAFEYEGMDGNWLNSKSLQEAICRAALAALEVK